MPNSFLSPNFSAHQFVKRLAAVALLVLVLHPGIKECGAAVLSWSGASGASANWNDSANWGFVGTPTDGDILVFPASQPRPVNTNNIVGLILNQIRFVGAGGGYAVYGNSFTLTNGIEATNTVGANLVSNNITLGSPSDFIVDVGTGAKLTLGGTLSGSVGLVKNGGGTNVLAGAFSNTFSGLTTVSNGAVELFKNGAAAIPHDLVIGDGTNAAAVRNILGSEIPDSSNVTINRLSTWDLNNQNETIGALTLSGGAVTTGTGTMTLGGDIIVLGSLSSASISGNLSLGGATRTVSVAERVTSLDLVISANISDGGSSAGINKTGPGYLTLAGNNTYSGVTTLDGFVILTNNAALGASGSPTNGTVVNGGSYLLVYNVNIGNEFLTLNAGVDYRSSGAASWAGPITLNGNVGINLFGGTFTNSGVISGPGGFSQGQGGTLILTGPSDNTFSGAVHVNTGVLELAKPAFSYAVPGLLVVGDGFGGIGADVVRYRASSQTDQVQVNSSGLLDLNGFTETLGGLTLIGGGSVQTGTGTLSLSGGVDVGPGTSPLTYSRISGLVNLFGGNRIFTVTNGSYSPDFQIDAQVSGSGAIIKEGDGEMSLVATNTFTGLTTVNNGLLRLESSFALGATSAGTVVNSGAILSLLSGIHVGLEPLTLNGPGAFGIFGALNSSFGSNSWDGAITLASNTTLSVTGTNDFLNLTGPIGGTGSVTKIGPGTLIFSGSLTNSYTNTTLVNEGKLVLNKALTDGAIQGALIIGDGVGGVNADVVQLLGGPQLNYTTAVTVTSSGLFDVNGVGEAFGSLAGSGNVTLGTGAIGIGWDNTSPIFSGVISGSGSVYKQSGSGTQTFNGNNTYTGITYDLFGTLVINGVQPQSPVSVSSGATLGGSGTVGIITADGFISPGNSPGILTSSNLIFSSSGNFTVELTGPNPGVGGYDQLNVHGTNSLANATFTVIPAFTNPVVSGQQFIILNNDGVDPIASTFNGLPEGAGITVNGFSFRLSYVGGSGNDVVLTLTNVPLAQAGTSVSLGNGSATIDPNECNYLNVVITNKTGAPITGISATLASTTPNVAITQPSSSYANVPANGKGTNIAPFQISTSPNFSCGTNINLLLTVTSTSHGAFTIPVSLTSGGPSAVPVRFDNNNVTNVPDVGTIESTNIVGSWAGGNIAKVAVSLWLSAPVDSALDLTLIAPDGTSVDLSSGNGAGASFGTGSADASRTTFDDAAGTSITAGTPPFVGSFQPETPLSALIGTSPIGNWRLRIHDSGFSGSPDTLRAWSLFLYGTACSPGGGLCELCPNVIITSATGSLLTQTNYVAPNGVPSVCGVTKVCPGTAFAGPYPSDNYTFRNGPSDACITITLENYSPLFGMVAAAYSSNFNPNIPDKCVSYLADCGNIVNPGNPIQAFSLNVTSNATFVVNLVAGGPTPYRLTVSGGDCRPVLNITPVGGNNVKLDWTTAAAGYALERTNKLVGATNWQPVTNVPAIVNSRFQVTNGPATGNQFYRLHKP